MTTREDIRTMVNEAAKLRLSLGGHDTRPMLRQALALAEQAFGQDSEETILPLEELARVLHIQAGCGVADPEGLQLNARAYSLAIKFPGPSNSVLAYVTDSLGSALTNTPHGLERGLQLMRDALGLVKDRPDRESWMTMGLASTLLLHQRFAEAVPYARRFLELQVPVQSNFMRATALLTLGHALLGAGQFDEAVHHLEQAKSVGSQLGRPRLVDEAQRLLSDAQRRQIEPTSNA